MGVSVGGFSISVLSAEFACRESLALLCGQFLFLCLLLDFTGDFDPPGEEKKKAKARTLLCCCHEFYVPLPIVS